MSWREELEAIVEHVPRNEIADSIGEMSRALALLKARLYAPQPENGAPCAPPGRYLTAKEVAAKLSVSEKWVYRHADQLGGLRLSGGAIRFPDTAIRRYLNSPQRRS